MNADPSSPDLYKRLGVSEDAGQEDIRAAFKAVRKELHPDGKPAALVGHYNAMMQNINEAYQTLSDQERRAGYNIKRRNEREKSQNKTQEDQSQSQQHAEEERRRQQEEEARRRAEEEQRRRSQEERRRAEEQARSEAPDDEEASWEDVFNEAWDVFEEATGADDQQSRDHYQDSPRAEPRREETGGVVPAGFVHRLPGVAHRAGIYSLGTWVWFVTAVVIWNLPLPGANVLAILVGLAIPVVAAVAYKFTLAHSLIFGTVERLLPDVGSFSAFWYGRRVIESAALAPIIFIISSLLGFLWVLTFFIAVGYAGVWGVEAIRRKRGG